MELTQADASYADGRMIVTLATRATLRTREGRAYLAQTQVSCREAGMVPAERGAPVIFACMERVGRDLAGCSRGSSPPFARPRSLRLLSEP